MVVLILLVGHRKDTGVSLDNTKQLKRKTIEINKYIPGNLYPVKEIEVKSSVSGTLEEYYVTIGDHVKAGDVIAKIRMTPVASQLDNAMKAVNSARIQLEATTRNYQRDSILFVQDLLSEYDFGLVQSEYMLRKEAYISSLNQLALLEGKPTSGNNLLNVVTAPSAGLVSDLPLKEGQSIVERSNYSDGTSIAQIAQIDYFIFKGKVVEEDVLTLKHGMDIKVVPSAIDTISVTATIKKISTLGKLEQGIMKYDIEAIFKVPENLTVYSGFSATAVLTINRKEDVPSLPENCLSFSNDSAYVYKLNGDQWEKTFVMTGISDGIDIEIVNYVSEDDVIKGK